MFNSTILDVAVGIIFMFLAVSLICGLLTEAWATIMSWRANSLLAGVQGLVNDPQFVGLAQVLYQHALVSPRDDGTATTTDALSHLPSYIAPLHFADALLDSVKIGAGTAAEMKAAIVGSPLLAGDSQMKTMLTGMADRSGGDLGKLRQAVAAWFDSSMDRVSGSYKRWTQLYCFIFGLIIAAGLDIDTLHVARALWLQPQITHAIGAIQDPVAVAKIFDSMGLPIGWPVDPPSFEYVDWITRVAGWIITALATLFGASFWFGALSGLLPLRGSGPSPAEKAQS
jgi:hypothetical protein